MESPAHDQPASAITYRNQLLFLNQKKVLYICINPRLKSKSRSTEAGTPTLNIFLLRENIFFT
jgi:hypothetical protein